MCKNEIISLSEKNPRNKKQPRDLIIRNVQSTDTYITDNYNENTFYCIMSFLS